MKSLLKFAYLLSTLFFVSCSCDDENLTPVCPGSGLGLRCVVDNSGAVITQGAGQQIPPEYSESGLCKFGISTCSEIKDAEGRVTRYNVICEGFVAASVETCDQLDNDCDNLIDEDFDADGDGWTQCDPRGADCWDLPNSPPRGFSLDSTSAIQVNPGALEICDGIDNDCDCWNSSSAQDTNTDGSACTCSTDPTCFGEGCCDAGVDEEIISLTCYDGEISDVMDENSGCYFGSKICSNGVWSECIGQGLPGPELCNGIDDDCDGSVDDDMDLGPCGYNQTGTCSYGLKTCLPNTYEIVCVGAVYPQNESCNGLDDDCDGSIDEELWDVCESQCGRGIAVCYDGLWIDCSAPQPSQEICDGIDNDCDGAVDNSDPDMREGSCTCNNGDVQFCTSPMPLLDPMTDQPASSPYSSCGTGIQACAANGEWGPCYFFMPVYPETCNNWDDDCDGQIDGIEVGCWTHPDSGVQPTDEGLCSIGSSICIAGEWGGLDSQNNFVVGLCGGEVWPGEEVCNELDDDCDGEVDEELNPHDKVDMVFAVDGSGSMSIVVDNLRQAMASYAGDFIRAECPPGSGQQCHRFALLVFPGHSDTLCTEGPSFVSLTGNTQGGFLVDVGPFQSALAGIPAVCADEPSLDVAYEIMDQENTQIGWRPDAYPYVIMITDEPSQTWTNILDQDVGARAASCQVGECTSGDPYEIYVITNPNYFIQWNSTTLYDPSRLKNLIDFQQSPTQGTLILQQIFQNVCLP